MAIDTKTEKTVIIHPALQPLIDDFCILFKVTINLYSPSDKLLLQSNAIKDDVSNFDDISDLESCLLQQKRMRHLASDQLKPLIYTSYTGMRYCLYPFALEGHLVAIAEIGNFRYGEMPSTPVIQKWLKKYGDIIKLQERFARIQHFSEEMEERLVRFFSLVAEHALTNRLIILKQNPILEKVIDYVQKNITRSHIPIEEVAKYIHRSPSTISHIVKKELGISFSRLVIEEKLKAAEYILLTNPKKPIGEIADELGYSDQFYFSKLFKKYRGISPSEWIKNY